MFLMYILHDVKKSVGLSSYTYRIDIKITSCYKMIEDEKLEKICRGRNNDFKIVAIRNCKIPERK